MEKFIHSQPRFFRAVVVRDRRFHAALLVEPSVRSELLTENKLAVSELAHTAWPAAKQVNGMLSHGVQLGTKRIGL
jgi:hypothetical protein